MKNFKTFDLAIIIVTIFLLFCLPIECISAKKAPFFKKVNVIDTIYNPLAVFSKEWRVDKYQACNTAKGIKYFTSSEKEIVQILNMVRLNPVLFLNSVILNPASPYYKYPAARNHYDETLITTLQKLQPNSKLLIPNEDAFISAKCHAVTSGKIGYVGHDRKNSNCKEDFYGECCSYGFSDAMSIVMALIFDYNVPSLGHREICLSTTYSSIGVSIQPHKSYEFNAVLDFK